MNICHVEIYLNVCTELKKYHEHIMSCRDLLECLYRVKKYHEHMSCRDLLECLYRAKSIMNISCM